MRQRLEDIVTRADHDRLLNAVRGKADRLAVMFQDEQTKTKATQDACVEMRVQIDENQIMKQQLTIRQSELEAEVNSLKSQLPKSNVARRSAEYEVKCAHEAFAGKFNLCPICICFV